MISVKLKSFFIYNHIIIIIYSILLSISCYILFFDTFGQDAGNIIIFPIISVAWFLSLGLSILINLFIYLLFLATGHVFGFFNIFESDFITNRILNAIILLLINLTVNYVSYLNKKTKKELEEHKKTQTLLTKQKNELSVFAHSMAHDLSSILTSISITTELLREKMDFAYINKINDQIDDVFKLLEKSVLLADSGKIISEKEMVDMNDLFERVSNLFTNKGINFDTGSLLKIKCDKEKIFQV